MNRYASLLGVLALAACASRAPPPDHVADGAQFFHITPVRPVADLLPLALAATPPVESGEFRPADLVELSSLDPTIRLDIRYATTRNFLGTPLYSQARAFMQRPAAQAVVRVQHALAGEGYGLLVHDAYRPWYVTKVFWDATPADKHEFVADPAVGSRHNRGCAVDLTLYDLKTGRAVEMPSLYDEMSPRAYPTYTGGTAEQRRLRDLLRRYMEAEGFSVYESEWWHFDYRDWKSYAIQNVRFEALGIAPGGGSPSVADTDPCTRFTWDVSRELAVMQQTPRALAAAVRPGADVPQIQAERLFEVKLALQSAVTFVAKPGKPTPGDGAYAGLVRLRLEKAGRYRVSISSGHWIDVVDGTQLMSSRDFQGQHGCHRPHKIVEFDLPADRDLTLQFSGSTDAQVIVAITAVSKPAAG